MTITHKNRALLKMASCKAVGSRFLRVSEDEINQVVENAMSKSIKSQTNWCQKGSKGITHYLGDKNRFDVSSEGPSSGISVGVGESTRVFI